MNLKSLLIAFLVLFSLSALAQKSQNITEIYGLNPVTVLNPIMIDSVDMKGEKFTSANLLKMPLSVPDHDKFTRIIKADTAGYFKLHRPAENGTLNLLSFYASSPSYAKTTLRVTSPNMLQVYVDGKLVATKVTQEDSLKAAKSVTTSLVAYPNSKRVVVKLLSTARESSYTAFKATIEKEDKDEEIQFLTKKSSSRSFEFNDVLTGRRVSSMQISPEGDYYLLTEVDNYGEKADRYTYLYNLKSGVKTQIAFNGSKRMLSWMPTTNKMYYVPKEGDVCKLVEIDPATLSEKVLAENVPNEQFMFSPDEKTLYYMKEEKGEQPKNDLKLLLAPEDQQAGFRDRYFIYRHDLETGLSQLLTFGNNSAGIRDISSDSKNMLLSVSKRKITARPFYVSSLYNLNLETMKLDTLWTDETFIGGVSFSPDNKKLLITGGPEAFGGVGLNIDKKQIANSYDTQAFIMDLSTKQVEAITKNFDPSINNASWNEYDGLIYFTTTDRDRVNVYKYDTSSKEYTKLDLNEEIIRAFYPAKKSSSAIYFGTSIANTTRAYAYDLNGKESKLISDPFAKQLSEIEFGKYGDWNFKSSVGVTIEGRYYLPPNFKSSKKYPMLVYYYGGTTPTARSYEHNYPPHLYAAMGYVVYVVNPSGAIGYGQKFSAMHVNAWGKRTAEDIIEGTKKFIQEHSFVDAKKVGCLGASYGGFMTMYLQTRTDIFAAAMSHAGISDITSYWGEGYWGYTYSSGASAHSYPWNNMDLYVKQSPLFSADKVKTPILLMHGTDDTNVPPGESLQMYTALKILGKPVEHIRVKGENHVIAKYQHRIDWMNSVMAWFDYWLKGETGWWCSLYPESDTAKAVKK